MSVFHRLLKVLRIIIINVIVLVALLLFLEAANRGYRVLADTGSFFRAEKFISPWITTYDYPPPMIGENGEAYFRHRDVPTTLDKPADVIRIISVGGSTTANERPFRANGIDYPGALQASLRDDFRDVPVEVLNAGGDAYSTAQSLINIEFRLVEFRPDIILLMHNINDSSVNSFRQGATSDYSNKYIQSYFLNPSLQGSLSFVGLLTQSRLLSRLGLPEYIADKRGDIDSSRDYKYGLHLFKRNLASIARICKLHNIDLVLLSQPYTLEPHRHIRKEAFLEYDRAIADVAREEGVYFIDMFSEFGQDKKYFVDNFHYSAEGIDRFASILAGGLAGIISARIEYNQPLNADN